MARGPLTPSRLFEDIDRRFAHGNFRDWVTLLQLALPLVERTKSDALTEKVVRATFSKMGVGG